jgi:RNA polymerase sigma-70 factor, ECF subfamily
MLATVTVDEGSMERALVEAARDGNRDAFAVLASRVVDGLYATARAVLRDTDRAEDAVQETLVRCWRDLPALRDADRFEAWLRRLLMHAITDEFRRGRRFEAKVRVLRDEPTTTGEGDGLDDRDLIERAFQRLSIDHRAILTLHHLVGLTLPEVAETLGIPLGTAKSRLHYAVEAMRAAVEADDRGTAATEVSA